MASPEFVLDPWELFEQFAGGNALHPFHDVRDIYLRGCLDKQMDMVFHAFGLLDGEVILGGVLFKDIDECAGYGCREDFPAVFGTPDDMVLNRVHIPPAMNDLHAAISLQPKHMF